MSNALWIGTTGLNASQKQMDIIGNNLANSSTLGYKSADTQFANMLSQSLTSGSGSFQVGQGVAISSVNTNLTRGPLSRRAASRIWPSMEKAFSRSRTKRGRFIIRGRCFRYR
jgi:flagellar hook protein FlgE